MAHVAVESPVATTVAASASPSKSHPASAPIVRIGASGVIGEAAFVDVRPFDASATPEDGPEGAGPVDSTEPTAAEPEAVEGDLPADSEPPATTGQTIAEPVSEPALDTSLPDPSPSPDAGASSLPEPSTWQAEVGDSESELVFTPDGGAASGGGTSPLSDVSEIRVTGTGDGAFTVDFGDGTPEAPPGATDSGTVSPDDSAGGSITDPRRGDVIIVLGEGDDRAVLRDVGGSLQLSSENSTFAPRTFGAPSLLGQMLHIEGGGGRDSLVVLGLIDLMQAAFEAIFESITFFGAQFRAASVTLTATDEAVEGIPTDSADCDALNHVIVAECIDFSARAEVIIEGGSIEAAGDILLTANATVVPSAAARPEQLIIVSASAVVDVRGGAQVRAGRAFTAVATSIVGPVELVGNQAAAAGIRSRASAAVTSADVWWGRPHPSSRRRSWT